MIKCPDKACAATTADQCKYPGTANGAWPGLCALNALRMEDVLTDD